MACWFSADQPFWGAALSRTGAGTSIKFSRLSADTLTAGIDLLLRTETASRAVELARSMTSSAESLRVAADLAEQSVHQKL